MGLIQVFNPITKQFDLVSTGGSGGGGSGGVSQWVDVTATTQLIAADTGYTADNNSTMINFSLPSTYPFGKVFRIAGKGSAGWQISQNAGQVIHFGIIDTTVGVTGGLSSTQQFDAIEILCTVANTDFTVINGPQGNIAYT